MTSKNRHLRGDIQDITIPVHGNVVVEKGDFILEFKRIIIIIYYISFL